MIAGVVGLIVILLVLPASGRESFAQSVAPTAEVGQTDHDDDQYEQLADRELKIGRYETSKKNFIGAINRFKTVITEYQRSRDVPEALAGLTECFFTLGLLREAGTAAAILDRLYPESSWTLSSLALLKSADVEPHEDEGSWISKAFRKRP
jgi:outer membrane protein assembly factor BamD